MAGQGPGAQSGMWTQIGDMNCNYAAARLLLSRSGVTDVPWEGDISILVAGALGISFADANKGLTPEQLKNGLIPGLNSMYNLDLRARSIATSGPAKPAGLYAFDQYLDSGRPMIASNFASPDSPSLVSGHTVFFQGLGNGNVLYMDPRVGVEQNINYATARANFFNNYGASSYITISNRVPTPRYYGPGK